MDKGIRLWTYAQPEQKNDKNSSISSQNFNLCFFTAAVGAARKIKRELFELSGLPEKPG